MQMRNVKNSDSRSQEKKCASSNEKDRKQKHKKQVLSQMSDVKTESIESIIAKMRLLSDVSWDSSEESWDWNEKSTEISGERDKEMRRNDESWRKTSDYLWTEKATMSCASALCSIWKNVKLDMINIWK